ncbi:ABC transporter ATP-binding protein [Chitinophaga vietnamensis]|uniref:ABC transporter ATP-binding protein n=1 Tax=Chitinophaga vietnamensis TaxID=2593957 RepID=UPI0011786FA7|nr:ATP-binding cassette domain-containing protein [Chitinophaga vietnamensis]
MIKVEHVSKFFGPEKKAVDDISFEVPQGETLVLLGTSGCGKTTTLRMINRLLDASSGRIYVNGQDIQQQDVAALRRNIGYVLQNNGLFPHYSVQENIAIVPELLRWNKQQIRERILTLMDKLHLPADTYAAMYPQQLSGGQQQRVGLARALAADPPVLLMDEPFGALDPLTRTSVRKEFLSLDELKSKTIILVTHDVEEAFELGDRICLMNEGRIQQIGKGTELLFKPANSVVQHFLEPQRLQLELKSLVLQDIWPFLSSGNGNSAATLPVSATCWEALAALTKGQVSVEYQQTTKQLNGNNVMEAIATYKKQ